MSAEKRLQLKARAVLAAILSAVLLSGVVAAQQSSDSGESGISAQSNGKKHRRRQSRPVRMGTSAGNVNDFAIADGFITCCSGTAGALITKAGRSFIISNNHVFAQSNGGTLGDPVSQPGRLDAACQAPDENSIATLAGFKPLKFIRGSNKADVAIAEVIEGMVDPSGRVLGIGVPGNGTLKPSVGLEVQKSGRTSGHTVGVIVDKNATVTVDYLDSCSPNANLRVARFKRQTIIRSTTNRPFSLSGDSGSVIYENVTDCPRAVGLLFAGNEVVTVSSNMQTVLKQLQSVAPKGKAELVGCSDISASASGPRTKQLLPDIDRRELRLARKIQARTESSILDLPGVHGMGIGHSADSPGAPTFRVYADTSKPGTLDRIPTEIDGIPVEVVSGGRFRALNCRTPSPLAGN